MPDYTSEKLKESRNTLTSAIDTAIQDLDPETRQKCMKYVLDPNYKLSDNAQRLMAALGQVRKEYNDDLDEVRSSYEARIKTLLIMLIKEIKDLP